MMKFEGHKTGFLGPITDLGTRGFGPSGIFAKMARGAAEIADCFHAAQMTAIKAERYYAMSDTALSRIGLTRDRIPEELLKELMHRHPRGQTKKSAPSLH